MIYFNQSIDVPPNNILLGIEDESILAEMEEVEISNPAPRKQLFDRTIYATRAMPLTSGEPILADLGEARFAQKSKGPHNAECIKGTRSDAGYGLG